MNRRSFSSSREARRRIGLQVEQLEFRCTPATLVNPTTLTYQDIDGDDVRVVLSKPILTPLNANSIFKFSAGTVNGSNSVKQQLHAINLTNVGVPAEGTNITLTATRDLVNGGDGFAAVGQINATGIDLGAVSVDGDLGRVLAGDLFFPLPGLTSLSVHSMGAYGTSTGAPDLNTSINGALSSLKVATDIRAASISANSIGSATIGGSIIGGSDFDSGVLFAGDIGVLRIGGNLAGGKGDSTGDISCQKLQTLTIGGSVLGGAGTSSGHISAAHVGVLLIGGDVVAGVADDSGVIVLGGLNSCVIGGSVIGSAGTFAGCVLISGDVASVHIGGDLVGGSAPFSGELSIGGNLGSATVGGSVIRGGFGFNGEVFVGGGIGTMSIAGNLLDGEIQSAGKIGSVTIGGSIIAGDNFGGDIRSTGGIGSIAIGRDLSGTIETSKDIGAVLIRGSVVGSFGKPARIEAVGQAVPSKTADIAIGRITVLGRVENAEILAGYDVGETPTNADAQIGTVFVGGNWIASSIVAGVTAGADLNFGTPDDLKISGPGTKDEPSLSSRIGTVTIRGQLLRSDFSSLRFGFVAEEIGHFSAGGVTIPVHAGKHNDVINLGITGDVTLREV